MCVKKDLERRCVRKFRAIKKTTMKIKRVKIGYENLIRFNKKHKAREKNYLQKNEEYEKINRELN